MSEYLLYCFLLYPDKYTKYLSDVSWVEFTQYKPIEPICSFLCVLYKQNVQNIK